MRRHAVWLAAVALVPALSACGGHHVTDAERLRDAMNRTALLSRRFVYSEDTGNTHTQVKGLVADDFRYKAATTVNDVPFRFNFEPTLRECFAA